MAAVSVVVGARLDAAEIGINFQDDWGSDGGAPVTVAAFGIPASRWYNAPRVTNSENASGVSDKFQVALPEGGELTVEWACFNTWSLYAETLPQGPGETQVAYGYLDDTSGGYQVTISGFRNVASDYSVRLIASTDDGDGFVDGTVEWESGTQSLSYGDLNPVEYEPGSTVGWYATTPASDPISAETSNHRVTISGGARNGSVRASLAGIILSYTPGGRNPPVVEVDPTPPQGTIYTGSTLNLGVLASGSPSLAYLWRLGGRPIEGATGPMYSKADATELDSGSYDVVISNGFGAVTSSVAVVTISPLVSPVIQSAPLSQALYEGYPATFAVDASGGQLEYQWLKGGVPMDRETNAVLSLGSISAADADTYTVRVRNVRGVAEASASLSLVTPGSGYEAAVAVSKPLIYFRMSESGVVAQDIARNQGNAGGSGDGVYVGSVRHGAAGALAGNGDTGVTLTGGWITAGYSPVFNPPGSFTVECWANPSGTAAGPPGVLVQSMINGENPDNSSDRSGWAFRQNGSDLEFLIGGTTGAPGYTTIATARGVLTAGVWNHCAAIYDSSVPSVTLVVRGVAVATVTASEPLIPNYAAPLLVGNRGYGGWNFNGSLDEVALYLDLVPASRLLEHYQTATNPATSAGYPALVSQDGAVEYLRLDEPGFTPSVNLADNRGTLGAAWHGTYVGAGSIVGEPLIATGAEGPRPDAFPGLDTSNAAVAMTNGWVTSAPLPISDRVTVACWMWRAQVSTTGDLSWPAWLGGGGLHLDKGNASNPDAELRYHWNGERWDWASGLYVEPEVWTFVALVVEPGSATIYRSAGSELESAVDAVPHAPMRVTSMPGFGGNRPERKDQNFIGSLDEVTVYDRALSKAEVTALFKSSLQAAPPPPSQLVVVVEDGGHALTWTSGVLQKSPTLKGLFEDVAGAVSPYPLSPSGGGGFYRLRAR